MIQEIIQKITNTKTVEELDAVVNELNAANTCARLFQSQKLYIQNAIDEHYEHIKNPCYEG